MAQAALAAVGLFFHVKTGKQMPLVNLKLLPKDKKGGGGCVIA